ncbi:MAG: SDR family oxidoreductase [Leptolyngbyaceae cyanobacterium MO_188.B28]|nr:SDR family oxidoreductase [Leptolyngbyaceae cyanobacterium MO_188.B28]
MKSIVITGSSRGIGYGLAEAFLQRGCQVTISGRSVANINKAVSRLQAKFGKSVVFGYPCDVSVPEQVQALWDESFQAFGKIDIWINNAGVNHPMKSLWELPAETVQSVIGTNLLGLTYCSQVAIKGMLEQGFGHLYNMEGHGSDGQILNGMAGYGASKSAVRYLTKALVRETQGTAVKVSTLSPGIVITKLIDDQFRENPDALERVKGAFNIFGDRVETVTPWLADRVLENDKSGAAIAWFTPQKAVWKLIRSVLNKRDLFALDNATDTYVGKLSSADIGS